VNTEIAKASCPVGCPPQSNLATTSEEEVEERREIINRLLDLTEKAQKGNKKVVPEIRQILDRNPDLSWCLANLARTAQRLLIDKLTEDKDLVAGEILEHQLDLMRQEVAGKNASPLERLLAERIVATWLQVQLFEALYFTNLHNLTLNQANYYQKRLDRAHRNHLSAIRTLAQIRRLGPSVQINIAEKQINTAG
jgi:hypothetical protein